MEKENRPAGQMKKDRATEQDPEMRWRVARQIIKFWQQSRKKGADPSKPAKQE